MNSQAQLDLVLKHSQDSQILLSLCWFAFLFFTWSSKVDYCSPQTYILSVQQPQRKVGLFLIVPAKSMCSHWLRLSHMPVLYPSTVVGGQGILLGHAWITCPILQLVHSAIFELQRLRIGGRKDSYGETMQRTMNAPFNILRNSQGQCIKKYLQKVLKLATVESCSLQLFFSE